ncbi:AraC family transcriptional regulator [Thalassotalea sp. G2M2-11]|uniref:AraC family transcriptional regulator n=1 Tax=Thalassotalea sp. G2M2-11 TaxID=2787627 RepID=UPI0019D2D5BF|nr:AraC family transcriptional regulator [Thalassotalea sp. G2M2-11]
MGKDLQYYVRAGSLSGYIELVQELGGDPIELMSAANIIPAQLHDPDNMILYSHLGDLLEITAKQLNISSFGTALGLRQNMTTVGLIGAFMCQQQTIGDALKIAQKYTYMHAQGAILDIEPVTEEQCAIKIDILVNQQQRYPQLMQLSIAIIYQMLLDMTGHQWKADSIHFKQSTTDTGRQNYINAYKPKVVFESESDSIHFSAKVLQSKPLMPENLVNDIVAKQFHSQQASNELDPVAVVCHAINMLLPTGDCSKQNIALSLGIHQKKLERMLQAHNTTYRDLLEHTRKDVALRVIQTDDMSMTALALNLGYSEFSAFSRSFKSWFSISPSHYKKTKIQHKS